MTIKTARPSSEAPESRPRIRLWGIAAAVTVALLSVGVFLSRSPSTDPPASAGPAAPQVAFDTFAGETVTIADFRGQPLVVNFFASWCPSCVAEMPDFETVHAALGERVKFIGVAMQDDPALADALRAQTGVTYETFLDPTGTLYQAFGGFAMPTTIFIDGDGRIVDKHSGVLFATDLQEKIEELFLSA